MSKRLLLAVCAVASLTGAALSQTGQPARPGQNTPAQTAPGAAGTTTTQAGTAQPGQPGQTGQAGIRTVDPTTLVMTFYTVQPTHMLVSNLLDTDVYNLQNEEVGEIEDLIINDGKSIQAIIISVGGFLGIGERHVAVQPGSVLLQRGNDGSMRAIVNTTREDLRNAPEFKFEGNVRRKD